MHVHVEKEKKLAKFTIEPIALMYSKKFNVSEISKIRRLIEMRKDLFKEK